jgi:hypothetical protein
MAQEANEARQQSVFHGQRHVFVVRIWLEPREIAGAVAEWRGMIEHLPTQERRYLNDLAAISRFITPYLYSMGIKGGVRAGLRRWLSQRALHRKP